MSLKSSIPTIVTGGIATAALALAIGVTIGTNSHNAAASVQNNNTASQVKALQAQLKSDQQANAANLAKASQRTKIDANAITAHLGVCVSTSYQNSGGISWVDSVAVSSPVVTNGVYQCTNGSYFVPVTPQTEGQ